MSRHKLIEAHKEADQIFDLFHPMPNDNERDRLYRKWKMIKTKINVLERRLEEEKNKSAKQRSEEIRDFLNRGV